ncbi:NAD(P)/FAD-dependent oxidoreductase [Pseudodonghicola flavimaris]|uniref:FAD-dependent oxidoreductase n=1 Tax=Pseudodonghicola flavimaris TaxID=3050036 RepID=A0ABT7F397_9RHOB|nr:FAD-dependent oxidoreductase [Pseudodonghicola flavimaris]MDK3019084.1 FAD-dependent oxidoreductase [Pseudodonghicola flavimaris]
MTPLPDTFDVLIVGAGPAGLSAAAELKSRGVASVHVVEREAEAGGIPRHCLHSPYGMREWGRVMFGPAYARRLLAEARAAGARIHTATTVTALLPGGGVELSTAEGLRRINARAVLLAMGARETPRAARLIGGTKPGGVMNTATLQEFAAFSHHRPFRRPVVLGSELVSFSALLTCRSLGVRPVAMIEPGARISARAPMAALPPILRVPLWRDTRLLAIHGQSQVESVTVETGGNTRRIACDGVIVTGGFRPENALLRAAGLAVDPGSLGPVIDQYGRLSDPAYFAAGNLLRGIETAGWCGREGRRVARAIAQALAGQLPDPALSRPLACETDAVAFALPQRLSPGGPAPAFDRLQLRLRRPYRGDIALNGARFHIASRPERRILRKLPDA